MDRIREAHVGPGGHGRECIVLRIDLANGAVGARFLG
jgi:hypothetical protein